MKKTITVIDTFGFLFRSYFALPPLRSKEGFPTGLLTGFINFIANIGKDFQTDYIVFALDAKGNTFRNDLYDNYKAQRPDVPEDLLKQLPIAISWIELMGFKTAIRTGFEADDIVASIAHDAKLKGLEVRIVSHDKDLYQLIEDDTIYLFDPTKRVVINEAKCLEKYGVHPSQFTDYQSLLGDSADNIPGVKGIGAKTAEALIQQFGTLENIYANLENIEKKRWKTLLEDSREMAFLSKQLVTLSRDCHIIDDLSNFLLPAENPILKISDILHQYDMAKVLDRINKNGMSFKTEIPKEIEKNDNIEYVLLDDENKLSLAINTIPRDAIVAFDTETTDIDTQKAQIVGFSFAYEKNKAYYVPIAHFYLGAPEQISKDAARQAITQLNRHKLVLQNFKYDYAVIRHNFDIELKLYADTMILSWLLNTNEKVGLDYQVDKYFNHKMISFKDVVKKGENFSNVDVYKACEYAAEDALMTLKLFNKQLEIFKEKEDADLLKLAFDLEFEFIYVLADMENNGIKVDVNLLQELKGTNNKYIQELTANIYKVAGVEFNINSPKQLGVVLFETLGLATSKKTKTGYSTDEAVLSGLVNEHDVIPLLLNYREAYKLQSTYIEPLLELGLKNADNRIHTSFLHTGTATGRLSSKNPNLQNIPVRAGSGSKIREAFIPKDGYKLVGIDYSQIELRLLAHFSGDEALVDAFRNDLDIHYQTAVKIFGQEQAKEKRGIAKSINFGLLYGMGSKKLGDTLGIPSKEAKLYIDSYFEAFKSVKDYLKSIEDFAHVNGFIKTLLNRKRLFDFDSANAMIKAAYLREAVNTLFQGSAADLIKLSMVKIYEKYKNNNNMRMLLQIHDELIFEVKDEFVEEITKDLKEIMENVYKLNIPLKVSVSIGNSWQELK
ncbi:DNA polymerase I, 5' -- 3' polymerase, 5' -- 3' and 3' -- 5' exonuclease [Arcobacter venerupis]|uniref:DNA polymerase I n=1 Tax=Arcobacter venerupis TaxID=1054033 RepID=A0AAE7BAT9_9BACT|nr:DNA polymerase I [Arcobacter venerupis]QKF67095.1 DNA polymerase I, 5' -- 3' polymerase, 5' -- 3' and 3' -- 5' exonuclease [Arcobacter venerupis]RWS49960.1 DNA polymerase I [Arcobacter venerupis]